MVEVIRGTDNSLALAVLVGASVFPTSRNHSRVGSDTFLRFWNCLLWSLVPFHAHLLCGCRLLIACVPPHVDVRVDSWSQHSLHHIFVPQWPHHWWHLFVCWWASWDEEWQTRYFSVIWCFASFHKRNQWMKQLKSWWRKLSKTIHLTRNTTHHKNWPTKTQLFQFEGNLYKQCWRYFGLSLQAAHGKCSYEQCWRTIDKPKQDACFL